MCHIVAVALLVLDLEVGDGGQQHRVPVDEPLAAVDEALVVEQTKVSVTTAESRSSIVKYSYFQATESPMRRICRVMVEPLVSFQSQTWAMNLAAEVVRG